MAPDLADPGTFKATLALDELSAAYHQAQPVAHVPAGNPMVVTTQGSITQLSLQKTNNYRVGVGQQPAFTLADASTVLYCQSLGTVGPTRLQSWEKYLVTGASQDPTTSTNLLGFLVNRYITSWGPDGGLNCSGLLNKACPITAVVNSAGLTTGGIFHTSNLIPASAFEEGGLYYSAPTVDSLSPLTIGLISALGVLALIVVGMIVGIATRGLSRPGKGYIQL